MKKKRAVSKKRSRPKSRSKGADGKSPKPKVTRSAPEKKAGVEAQELMINNRHVKISERDGKVSMTIDGVSVGMMFKSPHGTYNTHFFPSHTYDTPQEMAKMLVETEGRLWLLKKPGPQGGGGGMSMPGGMSPKK